MLNYITKIEDNKLYFDKNKVKHKKITGTYLAKLCGYSKFDSSDSVMLSRLGIYQPQIPEFYSIRGITIEPIVRDVLERHLEREVESWDARAVHWDNYPNIEVFGGLKDGQIKYTEEDGTEKNIVVEIKTTDTNKKPYWENEVPIDYYYQAGLYASLDNATDVYFVVAFCSDDVNRKFEDELKNQKAYRKGVTIDESELDCVIYKIPFGKKYQNDIVVAKMKAAENAQEIYDRGYIDLSCLPSKLLAELQPDLDSLK